MNDRQKSSRVTDCIAICYGCGWESEAANSLANAARHHDATGHHVDVSVTRLVTYGEPSARPHGQLAIDDKAAS